MLGTIWYTVLYQPVFNALIWIYTNMAGQNMGWAVIMLTIFLRLLLLPLTIISERNSMREVEAEVDAHKAAEAFKNDLVAQKEAYRKIISKHKISPWAKVTTLAVQVLVLILLYQVFMQGMSGEKMFRTLYPFIDFPGRINNDFYGFDISRTQDILWAGVAAAYLFTSILLENKNRKHWHGAEVTFLVFFPIFTLAALWVLPMVKSIFILTSMIFSDTITLIRKTAFPVKDKPVEKT